MPATFYDVEIDTNDALVLRPVQGATLTPEVIDLGARFQDVFNKVRVRVPATPGRRAYLDNLLEAAKQTFEEGDLPFGRQVLDQFDPALLKVRYAKVGVLQHGDLHLAPAPWAEKPLPPDTDAFIARIDKAFRKVRLLITSEEKLERHNRALESYARRGLEDGEIANATTALAGFENQFVAEEGPVIRKRHLGSTLRTAGLTILGLCLIGFVLQFRGFLPAGLQALVPAETTLKPLALLTVGVCLGIVFFAFVRNLQLTFDSLGNFDPAQLVPWLRFVLVGVITAILCILMSAGLIQLEINGLKLHDYMTSGYDKKDYAAVIVGILCGYSDAAITRMLTGVLDRNPA